MLTLLPQTALRTFALLAVLVSALLALALAARRIEAFIRRRIAAGDTKSEIKAKLVVQFGPAILAAPPRRGFDLLAWWLPVAGVLVGAIVLAGAAYRWSRVRAPTSVAAAPEPLDPALERRLDDELARFG